MQNVFLPARYNPFCTSTIKQANFSISTLLSITLSRHHRLLKIQILRRPKNLVNFYEWCVGFSLTLDFGTLNNGDTIKYR